MPQLTDPNFHRSVVQLVHHDEDGAFGLVINRRAGVAAGDLCDQLEIPWRGDRDAEVGAGGPVQSETGWVLFGGAALDVPDSYRVANGVNFAGSLEGLRALGETPPERVRLFLGYAGWGEDQLMEEILRNDWLTAGVDLGFLFAGDPGAVWADALRSVGVDPAVLPTWTQHGGHSAN